MKENQADETAPVASLSLAVTGGLAEGSNLRAARMIEVTPKGVRFLGEMSFEQYSELLRGWKTIKDSWQVALADIRAYGVKQFGQEKIAELFAQSGFDLADEARAIRLGQTTLDLRLSSSLTNEHFVVLCYIPGARQRGKWMAIAERENLSPFELQKSIEAGKVLRSDTLQQRRGSNTGINNIHGIRMLYDRWERHVGGEQYIFSLPETDQMQLLAELQAPGELYLKLKSSLAKQGGAGA